MLRSGVTERTNELRQGVEMADITRLVQISKAISDRHDEVRKQLRDLAYSCPRSVN